MLIADTYVARAGMRDQAEVETLITFLKGKGYLPIIRTMLSGMFDQAKLTIGTTVTTEILGSRSRSFGPETMRYVGDVFFKEKAVYVLIPREGEILQSSIISYTNTEQSAKNFFSDIETGIRARFDGRRVRGMEFDWKTSKSTVYLRSPGRYYRTFGVIDDLDTINIEADFASRKPEYTTSEAKAASMLQDSDIRKLTLKLAQVTKLREKEANELVEKITLDKIIGLGLLKEEYLLTCKQDSHTICVVTNKTDLNKEPMCTAKCSTCGRLFPDESTQIIYTMTELVKKLATRSLWMSIWVTELLIKNGVKKESIKWGLETNGEELDILVEDLDSRIFFELKDREFGLGDSYPFIYRLIRYGGNIGVIATMDKVAKDSQTFFKEESERREYPIEINQYEGIKGIEDGIKELIEDVSARRIRRVLMPFSERLGLDFWPIVTRWLQKTG